MIYLPITQVQIKVRSPLSQKPGFCDNFCILPKYLGRNPVSLTHAIALYLISKKESCLMTITSWLLSAKKNKRSPPPSSCIMLAEKIALTKSSSHNAGQI